jgi:hypothetical protein
MPVHSHHGRFRVLPVARARTRNVCSIIAEPRVLRRKAYSAGAATYHEIAAYSSARNGLAEGYGNADSTSHEWHRDRPSLIDYHDHDMAQLMPAFREASAAIKTGLDPTGIIIPGHYGIGL